MFRNFSGRVLTIGFVFERITNSNRCGVCLSFTVLHKSTRTATSVYGPVIVVF